MNRTEYANCLTLISQTVCNTKTIPNRIQQKHVTCTERVKISVAFKDLNFKLKNETITENKASEKLMKNFANDVSLNISAILYYLFTITKMSQCVTYTICLIKKFQTI